MLFAYFGVMDLESTEKHLILHNNFCILLEIQYFALNKNKTNRVSSDTFHEV